jgi:DNA-binding MarR family transcriptional regulator
MNVVAQLRVAIFRLQRELLILAYDLGLSPTQTSILGALERANAHSLTASEIAQREGLNLTLVSRTLAALAQRDLITRERAFADGRAHTIIVSASGHKLSQELRRKHTQWLETRLHTLSARERAHLLAAIPALLALSSGGSK